MMEERRKHSFFFFFSRFVDGWERKSSEGKVDDKQVKLTPRCCGWLLLR